MVAGRFKTANGRGAMLVSLILDATRSMTVLHLEVKWLGMDWLERIMVRSRHYGIL